MSRGSSHSRAADKIRRLLTTFVLAVLVVLGAPAAAQAYIMNPLFPSNVYAAALDRYENAVGGTQIPVVGPILEPTYSNRQCVEYVDRVYYYAMGYTGNDGTVTNAWNWSGNGVDYYGSYAAKGLLRYANGSSTRPAPGDILCLNGGYQGLGHVAIVTSVTDTSVRVLQQNSASFSTFSMSHSGSAYSVSVWSGYACQGWLRSKRATPSDPTAPTGQLADVGTGNWRYGSGTLTLSGTFADNVAVTSVRFYVNNNGTWIDAGADTHTAQSGVYKVTWVDTLAPGHPLLVNAHIRDAAGNLTIVGKTYFTYPPFQRPDGTLVQGSGSGVYLLAGGKKRPIAFSRVFDSRFRWARIVRISDYELASMYPLGKPVLFRDGTLISNRGTGFAVSNGKKRGIVSSDVFTKLGYSWANVKAVSDAEADMMPNGALISRTDRHVDGTLVQGSGGGVWLLAGGKKRPIPSAAVLESRFTWAEIVKISDTELAGYPVGKPVKFPDGYLISNQGTGFVISHGQKRGIVGAAAFDGLGYSWGNLLAVSDAEAKLMPAGATIGMPQTHPDGTLVQGSGSGVYLLERGKKRPIASGAILESRFHWARIVRISDYELASMYPLGKPVLFRDGTLISNRGTAFAVSNGKKRGIVSSDVFTKLGYSWANVKAVSDAEADMMPNGALISRTDRHVDGTLVQGSGGGVWLLAGGKKRPIGSPALLESRFTWGEVVNVTDAEFNAYPVGRPVTFPDGYLISNQGTVFVISHGQRRGIVGPAVFDGLGYGWGNVVAASDGEAKLSAAGQDIANQFFYPRLSVSLALSRGSVPRGGSVTASGRVSLAHNGKVVRVVVQRKVGSSYRTVLTRRLVLRARAGGRSRYAASARLTTTGRYRVRTVFADTCHQPAHSAYRYVSVR